MPSGSTPSGTDVSASTLCHRANAAVASADHDGIDLAALGLRKRPLGGAMQALAFDESDLGGDAMLRQGCGEAGSAHRRQASG